MFLPNYIPERCICQVHYAQNRSADFVKYTRQTLLKNRCGLSYMNIMRTSICIR